MAEDDQARRRRELTHQRVARHRQRKAETDAQTAAWLAGKLLERYPAAARILARDVPSVAVASRCGASCSPPGSASVSVCGHFRRNPWRRVSHWGQPRTLLAHLCSARVPGRWSRLSVLS